MSEWGIVKGEKGESDGEKGKREVMVDNETEEREGESGE